MAEIRLKNGKTILLDDADYYEISKHCWHELKDLHTSYARASRCDSKYPNVLMHRLILGIQDKSVKIKVDHINHNGLDNRRQNLRICTHAQNLSNMKKVATHSSSRTGVYFDFQSGKWAAQICRTRIGRFNLEHEAIEARNSKEKEIFGEYACV